uniref:ATP-dependent (S)-NAD(P)H-hydrate dehydratase n=1 Tax=Volvox carteri f. nagariensis TaxID=3068 RepID=D9CJ60_VOLCA|nr:MTM0417 [Volvox carteri f. nagariensis]
MSARQGFGVIGENRTGIGSRTATRNLSSSGERNENAMMSDEIRSEVRRIVPTLTDDRFKGQSGKVAVLGGCFEYTGPPYFASVAALAVGADLSHVFCSTSAAPIIKQYSPDILVHPYFLQRSELMQNVKTAAATAHVAEATVEVESWFNRLDCLVVGPGLGRDPLLLDIARSVILRAKAAKMPLVLDGDGLFLVAREPELVAGYTNCVLTPNLNEFRRLASTMGVSLHGPNNDRSSKLLEVTAHLRGPTLVSKGPVDAICDGKVTMICNASGGAKRCGSQGDILAGTIATFISWTLAFLDSARQSAEVEVVILPEINPMVLASYGACLVTRTAAAYAFAARKRAMVASDMLGQLGSAMEMLFDTAGGTATAGAVGPGLQGQGLLQAHISANTPNIGAAVSSGGS